jgi:hypothetical protein
MWHAESKADGELAISCCWRRSLCEPEILTFDLSNLLEKVPLNRSKSALHKNELHHRARRELQIDTAVETAIARDVLTFFVQSRQNRSKSVKPGDKTAATGRK